MYNFLRSYAKRIRKAFPALADVLLDLETFPLSTKKEIITAAQQRGFFSQRLRMVLVKKTHERYNEYGHQTPTRSNADIERDLWSCMDSVMCRSIIWMFARSIPENPLCDESEQVTLDTFMKEFAASQICFSRTARFGYEILIEKDPYNPQISKMARKVAYTFCHKLNRQKDIYAKVQRSKNVSQETRQLYLQLVPDHQGEVRTVDLEKYYSETGHMIKGASEMRKAWRFADLKPRLYYASGGEMYFAGRYMKTIAVALMESVPSTRLEIRKDPSIFLFPDMYTDSIIAWDYSNFTTSLSDLKYFLACMCHALDNLPVHPLRIVDSHLGKIECMPQDLLDKYNHEVNELSQFSIHRLVHKLGIDFGVEDFHQQNSGMLGVHGNIGFSTANHGFIACTVCGENRCVCVGDDALGLTENTKEVTDQMSHLGNIAPEKFNIIGRGEEGPIKFLKRGMFRDHNGIRFDYLWNLVNGTVVDDRIGFRTIRTDERTFENRRYKACTQLGALLWDIHTFGYSRELGDLDNLLLRQFVQEVFLIFKLPRSGFLPGKLLDSSGDPVYYACPPMIGYLEFDPQKQDWLEFLFSNISQMSIRIPIMTYNSEVEWPHKGSSFFAGRYRGFRLLEDLGFLKGTLCYEVVSFLSNINMRTLRIHLGREKSDLVSMYRYDVLEWIPERFDFMFLSHYDDWNTRMLGYHI